MAFPGDWGRKCGIVIQSSKVPSSQTDFPVLLTLATLPSEMFDADGSNPALNGGGDLRFSSDSAGSTKLACEVVSFVTDNTPANGSAEIHVKVPNVNGSSDTTIYVWYNAAGKSQPARDSAGDSDGFVGSENVWDSAYVGVWHGDDLTDSTSGGNDGTITGTVSSGVAGKVGDAFEFDGSNDYISVAHPTGRALGTAFTVQCWAYLDVLKNFNGLVTKANGNQPGPWDSFVYSSGSVRFGYGDGSGGQAMTSLSMAATTWTYVASRADGTDGEYTVNSSSASASSYTLTDSGQPIYFGTRQDLATDLDGKLDEIRVSDIRRSDDWITTEYNNQSDPATFVVEGTPEDTAGGGTTAPTAVFSGPLGGPLAGVF